MFLSFHMISLIIPSAESPWKCSHERDALSTHNFFSQYFVTSAACFLFTNHSMPLGQLLLCVATGFYQVFKVARNFCAPV